MQSPRVHSEPCITALCPNIGRIATFSTFCVKFICLTAYCCGHALVVTRSISRAKSSWAFAYTCLNHQRASKQLLLHAHDRAIAVVLNVRQPDRATVSSFVDMKLERHWQQQRTFICVTFQHRNHTQHTSLVVNEGLLVGNCCT